MAAVDYFLKIDGIPGESQDSKHKGEIEVESFSWGVTQTSAPGGGAGAGKVQLQDFHFVTTVSKASPKLFLACASGQHLKEATFVARKAAKGQQEFLVYKFSDVLISSYQTGGSGGEAVPIDQISLSFAKIEVDFRPEKPDGSLGAPEKAGWDIKKNKPA